MHTDLDLDLDDLVAPEMADAELLPMAHVQSAWLDLCWLTEQAWWPSMPHEQIQWNPWEPPMTASAVPGQCTMPCDGSVIVLGSEPHFAEFERVVV